METQGSGKTTRLFEEAISLVAELPEDHEVFVTGAHTSWLKTLEKEFKSGGLVGVRFFTIGQIRNGALRGRRGLLLVDDIPDLTSHDWLMIREEQEILRRHYAGRTHGVSAEGS